VRFLVVGALVVGCGGRSSVYETMQRRQDAARDDFIAEISALTARGDERMLAARMIAPLEYGGLWFPDADCPQLFERPGRISAAAIDALAACIAPLKLARSERQHPYPDVAVFTYGPGIEVEVAFTRDHRLRYIGFASRRQGEPAWPTITQAALEAHRVEPTPLALDAAAGARVAQELTARPEQDRVVYAWFKVCIDGSGAVTAVYPRETSSLAALHAYAGSLGAWKLHPVTLAGTPSPVCALVHVGDGATAGKLPYAVPADHPTAVVLPRAALGERVAGQPSPDTLSVMLHHGVRSAALSLAYCLDETGQVGSVTLRTSSGLPALDATVIRGVREWKFSPVAFDGRPVRACSDQTFVYGVSRDVLRDGVRSAGQPSTPCVASGGGPSRANPRPCRRVVIPRSLPP
jgi:TonB family protein